MDRHAEDIAYVQNKTTEIALTEYLIQVIKYLNYRAWAARISAPRLLGCSLLRSIAQNYIAQSPHSTHLKFHSAPSYKLRLSTNDVWCRLTLEGTRESVWTCARGERYRNGTGAKRNHRSGFWIKTRSDYISHAPLRSHALLNYNIP